MVLLHYPRKINYPQNIFEISLKTTNFFVMKKKVYVGPYSQNVTEN